MTWLQRLVAAAACAAAACGTTTTTRSTVVLVRDLSFRGDKLVVTRCLIEHTVSEHEPGLFDNLVAAGGGGTASSTTSAGTSADSCLREGVRLPSGIDPTRAGAPGGPP